MDGVLLAAQKYGTIVVLTQVSCQCLPSPSSPPSNISASPCGVAVLQQNTQHSTAQHSTAQHSTAQHSTAQRSAAQHSTARHSTARHNPSCQTLT